MHVAALRGLLLTRWLHPSVDMEMLDPEIRSKAGKMRRKVGVITLKQKSRCPSGSC